jgi:hypothetical protein
MVETTLECIPISIALATLCREGATRGHTSIAVCIRIRTVLFHAITVCIAVRSTDATTKLTCVRAVSGRVINRHRAMIDSALDRVSVRVALSAVGRECLTDAQARVSICIRVRTGYLHDITVGIAVRSTDSPAERASVWTVSRSIFSSDLTVINTTLKSVTIRRASFTIIGEFSANLETGLCVRVRIRTVLCHDLTV